MVSTSQGNQSIMLSFMGCGGGKVWYKGVLRSWSQRGEGSIIPEKVRSIITSCPGHGVIIFIEATKRSSLALGKSSHDITNGNAQSANCPAELNGKQSRNLWRRQSNSF